MVIVLGHAIRTHAITTCTPRFSMFVARALHTEGMRYPDVVFILSVRKNNAAEAALLKITPAIGMLWSRPRLMDLPSVAF